MLTISNRKRIISILKNGKIYESKYLKIYYLKLQGNDTGGFVVTAPRRIGKAVKRNYIKRIIKNILRHKEYSYDLIIKPKLSNIGFKEMKDEFDLFWRIISDK
ncbi:MAG: ribonuclease P protein component [Proteobacteria bacterium]|nr:ribonuclease P protein component [Pseudomonadota bacterium]